MIVAESEKLSRLEVDEGFLSREQISGNKRAEQSLGMNQAQQKATKKYIEYLAEKYRAL